MKYTLIILSLIVLFSSCNNTKNSDDEKLSSDLVVNPKTASGEEDMSKLPVIEFEYLDFDFGLIFEGEEVVHKFKFKNTGGSALIISDVSATCGCTIPTYSRKPIAPGEEGLIEVKFNSSGREGMQHKTVTVLANTQPNRINLSFVAEVEAAQ